MGLLLCAGGLCAHRPASSEQPLPWAAVISSEVGLTPSTCLKVQPPQLTCASDPSPVGLRRGQGICVTGHWELQMQATL